MKISRPVLINTSLGVVIAGAIAAGLIILLPAQASSSTEATQLTSTVQQGVVSSTITASGSVAAVREVSANFAVSGTVATVDVALGSSVTAGQQLGTLVTTDLDKAVTDAATAVTRAKADLVTANEAVTTAEAAEAAAAVAASTGQGGSSGSSAQSVASAESAVTDASDKVDDANDALVTAQNNRAAAILVSPINGLVTAVGGLVGSASGSSSSSTTTGGTTTTSSGFVTIADVSQMTMTAAIAEADIALVAVGQTATVTFPALTDVTTTATVTAIAPTGTTSNSVVTYSTTITLDTIPEGLRLGQTAEVTITTVSSAEDALYVPTAAITTATDGTSTVDVVGDDDEVTTTTVELGVAGDSGTEITSGLELGQTIVLGEVAASTGDDATEEITQQGGFGGGTGGFTGGGTPPTGGTFPGGN
ncbi:macrolide-specific efflux system membrane fusion protein [Conyzicola lurida]|uniref:Macrolide-specific efflux system membrane fusion protein n=1 Tax=Conyzicola lurida TaxID=1172621 RepID=A0A841AH74_9MICO|nr:efflux RND transporter periplasmic adaptor subunit [Conyzicola lurida]MBB5841698.1 macrolide-specific efflux system membrane fusion protein [Conyzicola lurida]